MNPGSENSVETMLLLLSRIMKLMDHKVLQMCRSLDFCSFH